MKLQSSIPLLAAAALLASGCNHISYKRGDVSFSRTAFGSKTTIGDLSVDVDPANGVLHLGLKGYESDQVQAIGAVAKGVAEGLGKAVAP